MLQIAANPYVTILGPEPTAASRLNLAQGFNAIGTTIGPLINAAGVDKVRRSHMSALTCAPGVSGRKHHAA